jgi:acyl-CoA thioester hydrolase
MKQQTRRGAVESAYSYWTAEAVRWSDTDQLGHVNHLAVGAYFETGRARLIYEIKEKDQVFVAASLTIDYLKELHWPEPVSVGTAVIEIGRASCKLVQGLFSKGKCVALAHAVVVLIHPETRRPREIPSRQRERLEPYLLRA